MEKESLDVMEEPFDTMEYTFVAGSTLPAGRHKSIMRRIGKYSGGVTHVTLTIPTYLIDTIDLFTSSRSAYITLAVEKHMRYAGLLNHKWPSLTRLYYYLVHMDLWAMQLRSKGRPDWSIEKDKTIKSYRAYFKRFGRHMQEMVAEVANLRLAYGKLRKEIREPFIRSRPDMVRKPDSESARELGKENESYMEFLREHPEAKRELYHESPEIFKSLFPDDFEEWEMESDSKYENERDDPPEN